MRESGGKQRDGNKHVKGGGEAESGPPERRKRNTGVHFAQQMLKHLRCLLRASGSLHAGKQVPKQRAFNCRPTSRCQVSKLDKSSCFLEVSTLNFQYSNSSSQDSRGIIDFFNKKSTDEYILN